MPFELYFEGYWCQHVEADTMVGSQSEDESATGALEEPEVAEAAMCSG